MVLFTFSTEVASGQERAEDTSSGEDNTAPVSLAVELTDDAGAVGDTVAVRYGHYNEPRNPSRYAYRQSSNM